MSQKDYTTINTLIDVYSEYLLTPTDFEDLLNASSKSALMDVLDDTEYRIEENDLDDGTKIDRKLMDLLIQVYRFAYERSPEAPLVDIFGARYMYHNLKILLKDALIGTEFDYLSIPIGRFNYDQLQHVVQTRESRSLPPEMIHWINEVHEQADDYHSTEAIDIGLDMAYFDHLKRISEDYGNEDTEAIVQAMIEFYNITTIIRAQRQDQTRSFMIEAYTSQGLFTLDEYLQIVETNDYTRWFNAFNVLPYHKGLSEQIDALNAGELSIGQLEKLKDDYLYLFFQEKRFQSEGPLKILEYIFYRELEVTNLRLVLVGRVNGLSQEQIKERMRPINGE
ncbi:V-type ATPase subunit [Aerococcaceae bacterium DSM 111020]|nr:V-type ATPase subunit [Aerococcaceae bacterium DSM 111020]